MVRLRSPCIRFFSRQGGMQTGVRWVYNRLNMSQTRKAFLAIIIASLLWATTGSTFKLLFLSFDPISIMFLRMLVTSALLFPVFMRYNTVSFRNILRHIVPVSLYASLNFLLYVVGLAKTTADSSTILYTITPLLAVVISRISIGEKTSRIKIAGILMGFIGAIFITALPMLERRQSLAGNIQCNILILLAAVTWTLFTTGSRKLTSVYRYSSLVVTCVTMFTCCVVFLVLTAAVVRTNFIAPLATGSNILLLLHLCIFVTCVTFFLHQWVIAHTSAVTGTLNTYITPVFAFVINAIVLEETLSFAFVIGSVCIGIGTFIATSEKTVFYVRNKITNRR